MPKLKGLKTVVVNEHNSMISRNVNVKLLAYNLNTYVTSTVEFKVYSKVALTVAVKMLLFKNILDH